MTKYPITPPPELVDQWIEQFKGDHPIYVAIQAAQWGADQELEAVLHLCDEWLTAETIRRIRATRRPKPPNLKEQALAALGEMSIEPCVINGVDANASVRAKYNTIRRALEALPDD
jgi:hypothetical protein